MKLPFMVMIYGAVGVAALCLATHPPGGRWVPPIAIVSAKPVAAAKAAAPAAAPATATSWSVPDVDKLPGDAWGKLVRLGRDLTVATYAHIGPEVADPAKHYAGNNLSCQNCHLGAGAKQFGLPFVGVFADFPQYRGREGRVGSLEDRINGCMERSMNGRALPLDSTEMAAFVAYIKFLSTGIAIGAQTSGRGAGDIPRLTRAADPDHGKLVFGQTCASCHGQDGQGKRHGPLGDAAGYEFPPVWGPDSFNDGAGMNRLISGANFVHSNMPNGTVWSAPALSAEDAWDVTAYLQGQPRPARAHLENDFPVRLQKPVDAGYGPYIDGFDRTQHRLGPFGPIEQKIKELKAEKSAGAPPTATPGRS
ncbi:MAG: cystathionine gamma-synthase [Rhodospirillales bacterium]|nr:cystathionine gamma-synthase [Rhodospirillales bacterium]